MEEGQARCEEVAKLGEKKAIDLRCRADHPTTTSRTSRLESGPERSDARVGTNIRRELLLSPRKWRSVEEGADPLPGR